MSSLLSLPAELFLHCVELHVCTADFDSVVTTMGRILTSCKTVRDRADWMWQKVAEAIVLPLQPLLATVPNFNMETV